MPSSKDEFAKGLCYIKRDIADEQELYDTGEQYLKLIEAKAVGANYIRYASQINRIKLELKQIKKRLNKHKADFKYYMEYFSYTKDDLIKYNIHPSTDEELEADYAKDMKELKYTKSYSVEAHREVINKANEFNRLNNLPLLSF